MRRSCTYILLAGLGASVAACGGSSNNASVTNNAANMRGTNTNTGYVTNINSNVPPPMPTNVTNISPPNINMRSSNSNTSHSNSNIGKMPPGKAR